MGHGSWIEGREGSICVAARGATVLHPVLSSEQVRVAYSYGRGRKEKTKPKEGKKKKKTPENGSMYRWTRAEATDFFLPFAISSLATIDATVPMPQYSVRVRTQYVGTRERDTVASMFMRCGFSMRGEADVDCVSTINGRQW
jgi:hypothetical protein